MHVILMSQLWHSECFDSLLQKLYPRRRKRRQRQSQKLQQKWPWQRGWRMWRWL